MKRSSRGGGRTDPRRSTVTAAVLVAGALALSPALSACSFLNPKTTAVTYDASDGVNGQIVDEATGISIQLRNMLLVAAEPNAPGLLIGAVSNEGDQTVNVTLTVLDDTGNPVGGGTVRARAQELTEIGGDGTTVRIASVPTAPGTNLLLQVDTPSGGDRLSLPVLAPEGPYADVTPSASPSTPAAAESPSPSPAS